MGNNSRGEATGELPSDEAKVKACTHHGGNQPWLPSRFANTAIQIHRECDILAVEME